jgi:hypothetical protein
MIGEMDVLRSQYLKVNQLEHQLTGMAGKDKECAELRRELNRKRELIDGMRDKEKNLLEALDRLEKGG